MRNFLSRLVNSVKKHKILSAMIVIIVALFVWWAFVNLTPKPLGDKMEYLGKEDYGCWVGFCDARPYSVYYYGTDLSEEEVVGYFKGSKMESTQQETATTTLMRFTLHQKEFYVSFYTNNPSPFVTDKKYIISIPSFHYDLARDSK